MTSFRTQNIPPPMSSHQLNTSSAKISIPIHIAFSRSSDALLILLENGEIELWELHTRLQVGHTKATAITPALKYKGSIETPDDATLHWRQIVGGADFIYILGMNGNGKDIVACVDARDGDLRKAQTMEMTNTNGRLLSTSTITEGIYWQTRDGDIFFGMFLYQTSYILC